MKLIKNIEKELERIIGKVIAWSLINRNRIILFLLISLFISFLSFLPYVNLYLTSKLVVFFLLIIMFAVFRIAWDKIIPFVFLLFLFSLFFTLLKNYETASLIGNYIYGVLLYVFLDYVWRIQFFTIFFSRFLGQGGESIYIIGNYKE